MPRSSRGGDTSTSGPGGRPAASTNPADTLRTASGTPYLLAGDLETAELVVLLSLPAERRDANGAATWLAGHATPRAGRMSLPPLAFVWRPGDGHTDGARRAAAFAEQSAWVARQTGAPQAAVDPPPIDLLAFARPTGEHGDGPASRLTTTVWPRTGPGKVPLMYRKLDDLCGLVDLLEPTEPDWAGNPTYLRRILRRAAGVERLRGHDHATRRELTALLEDDPGDERAATSEQDKDYARRALGLPVLLAAGIADGQRAVATVHGNLPGCDTLQFAATNDAPGSWTVKPDNPVVARVRVHAAGHVDRGFLTLVEERARGVVAKPNPFVQSLPTLDPRGAPVVGGRPAPRLPPSRRSAPRR